MQNNKTDISERLLNLGVQTLKLVAKLDKTTAGRHISNQLLRSVTSSGANYEEACGAESKTDFIHKMQLVLKELRESIYWLKLINRSSLTPQKDFEILLKEANELVRIIAKSIVTAKGSRK